MKRTVTRTPKFKRKEVRPKKKENHATGWHDISVPIRSNMVHWPGDTPVQIERVQAIARGDDCNVSRISMSSHTGTHMDAPRHFLRSGRALDQMPLNATVGPVRVIKIRDQDQITVGELRPYRVRRGERLLFKTQNSSHCWKRKSFVKAFVHLSNEAANFLAESGVRAVGVDYLSVGPYRANDSKVVHRALLRAGVWIIEGLDLSRVRPGMYELVCLPIKIFHGDGAPARAILRPLRSG
jgi:arylformamidase